MPRSRRRPLGLDEILRRGEINPPLLDQLAARLVSESVAHHAHDLLPGKGLLLRLRGEGRLGGGTRNVGPNSVRPRPSAAQACPNYDSRNRVSPSAPPPALRKGSAFPAAPHFIQPLLCRGKAAPSRGREKEIWADFARKGAAFPQSRGQSPRRAWLIWTGLSAAGPYKC